MQQRLVLDLAPGPGNQRNSEGSFLRMADGTILFAYSRYRAAGYGDHCACDIALVRSGDEGESWSAPEIIALAEAFGVDNVMSVSALALADGRPCFYFLIKQPTADGAMTTGLGRAVSADGARFTLSRCRLDAPPGYYIVNNDRFIRLGDGRIAVPASLHPSKRLADGRYLSAANGRILCLASGDDGASFAPAGPALTLTAGDPAMAGEAVLQEPGLLQRADGSLWLWMRTGLGCQYQSLSRDGLGAFPPPEPSPFTSPMSPMEVLRAPGGALYAAYNPIPEYDGRPGCEASWGRTPLVVRRSDDDGATWGPLYTVEDDPDRGYCYPAMLTTRDGCLLLAYCRGGAADGWCLSRLGAMKIPLSAIPGGAAGRRPAYL